MTMSYLGTMARALTLLMVVAVEVSLGGSASAQSDDDYYDPKPDDQLASNLGIFYQLVPRGNAFGAKVSGKSRPATPLMAIGLKSGDVIIAIDDQPIKGDRDLQSHFSRTSITFVDARTGETHKGMIDLPGMELRIRLNQDSIRQFAARALRDKTIAYRPPVFEVDGDLVRSELGEPLLDDMPPGPVFQVFQVEIIRLTRSQPNQRAFWEPYLRRVEAVIAEEIAAWNKGLIPTPTEEFPYHERIEKIYEEAFRANATAIGKRYAPPEMYAQAGPGTVVKLLTSNNQGVIYAMPRTKYLIRQLDEARRPVQLIEFDSITPNTDRAMDGDYVYKIVYPNGTETPLRSLRIEKDGPITLR